MGDTDIHKVDKELAVHVEVCEERNKSNLVFIQSVRAEITALRLEIASLNGKVDLLTRNEARDRSDIDRFQGEDSSVASRVIPGPKSKLQDWLLYFLLSVLAAATGAEAFFN